MNKIIYSFVILIACVFLWFANYRYPNEYILKGFYTFLALFIIYFAFKVIIEELGIKKIKDSKTKYSFKKTISIIYSLIFLIVLATIWIEKPEALFLAFGLIGAGIAIALQDVFKNFAGGIIIFVNEIFRVGDRIEIDGKIGDVIDISILYSTLLELEGWVTGDQASGRLIIVPNGHVLSSSVFNYTKDHNFIWDEMILPITYDSDWRKATEKFLNIVTKETNQIAKDANKSIASLEEKYYLTKRVTVPSIYIKLTDNWIEFYIRYTTEVRQRRVLKNKLYKLIFEEIEKSPDIKLASSTMDITAFPDINIKQKVCV